MNEATPSPLNNVITIDDERIKSHLDRVVRGSVEETLNALLDAEADRLCNAQRYERSAARQDTRVGYYERNLQTKAGEVRLKVCRSCGSKLLRQPSLSVIGAARARSRRRSSRCTWPGCRCAGCGWRISPRPCGGRGYRPRQCRSSTRRSMRPSMLGATDRSSRLYHLQGLQMRLKPPRRRVMAKLRDDRSNATEPNQI
jgi:hypothetical protein